MTCLLPESHNFFIGLREGEGNDDVIIHLGGIYLVRNLNGNDLSHSASIPKKKGRGVNHRNVKDIKKRNEEINE